MKTFLPLALVSVIVAGCNPTPSVVGKWSFEVPSGIGKGTMDFRSDNTVSGKIQAELRNFKLEVASTGTYSLQNGVFEILGKEIVYSGVNLPPGIKAIADNRIKSSLSAKGKIEWIGNDEFTVTPTDGKSIIFRRVKA